MRAPTSGGQGLGNAQGRISIDTSDLARVSIATQQVGADVERSFGRINTAAGQTQQSIRQLAGMFGIGFGIAQMTRFVIVGERLATTYARQSVAAVALAGSQAHLNSLLEAYDRATGGAIDRATALSDVTMLMTQGLADSAEELESLLIGVRGASIAMGTPQEFIITRLQLELMNQTGQRLNEIGLSMADVNQRTEELRAANAGLSKELAYQQAVLELLEERFGEVARSEIGAATEAEQLGKTLKDLRLELGQLSSGPVNTVAGAMLNWLRDARRDVGFVTDAIRAMGMAIRQLPQLPQLLADAAAGGVSRSLVPFAGAPDVGGFGGGGGGGGFRGGTLAPRFTPEQEAAMLEFEETRQAIERDAHRARLDATESYEQQRTQTIRRYEQMIAREAEDFARQRARAEQQFADQIADIRADAARREARQLADLTRRIGDLRSDSAERVAEWEADHAERIAELRAEGNRRLAEMEEEYQRDRQRALEQHRETLLGAAARLDAAAVLAEQRRFARQQREAAEDHSRRTRQERDNLDERIAQEQEAHEERLRKEREQLDKRIRQEQEAHDRRIQDARDADERRIQDMKEDFEERKRLEDEDRAIRLQRMAEDHADQLAEMDRQQALRLAQIDRHAREELKSAEDAHAKALNELGIFNATWKAIEDARMRQSLLSWDQWWEDFNKRFTLFGPQARPEPVTPSWQDPFSWGASWDQGTATTSSTSSTSVVVHPGAIIVQEAQRPGQTAAEVEEALITILGRLQ